MYVPELAKNLFSRNHALDQGLTIEATSTDCKLSSKDGTTVVVGVHRGAMTVMQIKVKKSSLEPDISANMALHQSSLRNKMKQNDVKLNAEQFTCEACMFGKHHRSSFSIREEGSKKCGEIIHADVCGPMQETSFGGSRYFILFKDDYSHFRSVYCLARKTELYVKIKVYIKLVENAYGHKISILRTDNGTEFKMKI